MENKVEDLATFYGSLSQTSMQASEEYQYRRIFMQTYQEHHDMIRKLWDLERKLEMYAYALIPREKHFNKSPSS